MRRLVLLLMICGLAQAGSAAAEEPQVEALRTDLRADMTELVDASMELNEAQEEIFWPLYQEYEREMSLLGDRRLELMRRFGESGDRLSEPDAKAIAGEWFDLQETRLSILKRTFEKMSDALAPSVAARFIQVENQLGLMIDLQLASEAPLIKGEAQ